MIQAVAMVVAAGLAVASAARAQLDLGPEFQVNTYTPGPQRSSSVVVRGDGSLVVTWQSGADYTDDPPGDTAAGVFLQRFAADGSPLGAEQHVNTFTIDDQRRPDVAGRADGGFVVVWESGCRYGTGECSPDGAGRAVAAQRFDAAGTPIGGEQLVNTVATGSQYGARVAAAPSGEFVIAWATFDGAYPKPSPNNGTAMRRFAADGTPAGDEQQVNASTLGFQDPPDVAVDATGNFVVVWSDFADAGGYLLGIHGRRYDASGAPLGDLAVGADTAYSTLRPLVAAAPGGEFVVVWQTYDYEPSIGSEIRGRRFGADGTPLGPVFAVNTYVPSDQFTPAMASDAAGNFVVAWVSNTYTGPDQDGDGAGIFAQAFAHDGAPLGSEFQVNAYTTGFQTEPAVSAGAAGEFVVTWTSAAAYDIAPQDGSGAGVFARTLALHPCAAAAECDDANPCTADACEGSVCLNRRQAGCCRSAAECWDGEACTDDVCTGTTCSHEAIAGCMLCSRILPCEAPGVCMSAVCRTDLGRCEFTHIAGCCVDAGDCDDGFTCTEDTCAPGNVCAATPIPGCVACSADAECATGCLIAPETCAAGRCESPAGCPVVTIAAGDPIGTAGGLLASVEIPADVPGKGKVKAVARGTIGPIDPDDHPSRRYKEGKVVARGHAVIEPGGQTNLLLALTKAGERCLAKDPDGALPVEVTIGVRRKKTALSEVVEPRTWRR